MPGLRCGCGWVRRFSPGFAAELLAVVFLLERASPGSSLRSGRFWSPLEWLAGRSSGGAKTGGGGSRTPVREYDSKGLYMFSLDF